jgi:hypothetical protein
MNGSRKCGTCTQWNFTQPGRRMKFIICRKMDGNREHHPERVQPVSEEDQKSYVLSLMRTLDLGQMQQCGWTWIT